jgi:DNA repair protein RecO (recombination protein O)
MPAELSPALLLRATDRGDDDRWLSLLTSEQGRLHALARHARGSKRRFGGSLQPFVLFEAALRHGSGGLLYLEDARALEHPLGMEAELAQMEAAWLFLELAEQCCPLGQPQPAFFELLLNGLRRVGKRAEALPAVRLSVLWNALALEGWAPHLDACARCASSPPWPSFRLDPLADGCLCPDCYGLAGDPPLDGAVLEQWQAAAQGRPISAVLPRAEAALLAWTEHQIGKPLRSPRMDLSQDGA